MLDTSIVQSNCFEGRKFATHGRNIWMQPLRGLFAGGRCSVQKKTTCWKHKFNDISLGKYKAKVLCQGQWHEWTYEHFRNGCPNDGGRENSNIKFSLIDFIGTTGEKLQRAGHNMGNCMCCECEKLRRLESKWIMRLGTFHGETGLNRRNILNTGVRVHYQWTALKDTQGHLQFVLCVRSKNCHNQYVF